MTNQKEMEVQRSDIKTQQGYLPKHQPQNKDQDLSHSVTIHVLV